MRGALIALGVAVIGAGCPPTAGNVRTEGPRAARPGWIPSPNRTHPDLLYVTAGCRDQTTMSAARACALDDARRQIQTQLGAAAVEIQGSYVKDEYSELRQAAGGTVRDLWLLVAYPRGELRKAEDRVANRVLLGLACQASNPAACDPRYPERIEAAMTSAGMTPAPQRLSGEQANDVDAATRMAGEHRAAQLLLGTLDGKFLSSMDGEYYAEARCGFRLIDALSRKVRASFDSGPVKGGHLSEQAAVRKALDNCVKQLEAKIAALPR